MRVREIKEVDVPFKIIEHVGVLSESSSGRRKELNIISWDGKPAEFDVSEFDANYEHVFKGFALNPSEVQKILLLMRMKKLKNKKG